MNDDLNTLLKAWAPAPHTTADIRGGVWQRIERTEPTGWRVTMESLFARMMRPAFATGLVAIAIMAGVTLGSVASESAQTQAYLNSVTAFRLHR